MASIRQPSTYRAVYRLAARPYGLSNAFGAAGRKQYATISHAATALNRVTLQKVLVGVTSASAAAIVAAELVRLTDNAAATGNPAITPRKADSKLPTAEVTCLALPTTPGTEEAGPYAVHEWNLGITAGGSVVNPPPALPMVDLLAEGSRCDFSMAPVINQQKAEGFAVTFDASAAATIVALVVIEFTEEVV